MCNKRSCKKGGFLLLGAILGFIFGMFFAPKKGSELRKETKEKFNDVKENRQICYRQVIAHKIVEK